MQTSAKTWWVLGALVTACGVSEPQQTDDAGAQLQTDAGESLDAGGESADAGESADSGAPAPDGGSASFDAGAPEDAGALLTIGVGGDRRYATTDGNRTIFGDVQDLLPSDADWSDGHTDTMIRGLCAGAGRFLAVGGQSNGTFRSTTDGVTWTVLATLDGMGGRASASWLGGCAYGNGRFVAAGGNGSRCHSTDGLSWTCPQGYQQFHHRAVAFGGGRFVTVGNSYASPAAHITSVSPDGIAWTHLPALLNRAGNRVIYAPAHGRFYAVFGDALGQLVDGEAQWTQVASVDASGTSGLTVKGSTVYLAGTRPMAPYARFLLSSATGQQWTTQTPNVGLDAIHYDPRSDRFLGTRRQYQAGGMPPIPWRTSSLDAVTWTEVTETSARHGIGLFVTGAVQ